MKRKTDKLIRLRLEGLTNERGHIKAAEFLAQLDNLLVILNGIDKVESGSNSPKLYYRIVDATHSSPFSLTLEPVVKTGQKVPKGYAKRVQSRFFTEAQAIRGMAPISPEIDTGLLERFRDLVAGVGRDFKRGTISNGKKEVDLDAEFEKNVGRMLGEEDVSYGSIDGKLDAVNIHGPTKHFWIYPTLGPQKVRCDFLPGTSEGVRKALGCYVRVMGLKSFRPPNPYPFRIRVREFEVLSEEDRVSLESLRGTAPHATGEMSSVEFVRQMRDEWD